MRMQIGLAGLVVALFLTLSGAAARAGNDRNDKDPDPRNRDSILDWNDLACHAVAVDHTGTFGAPDQGGPTRASRAMAIVHVAMFDAANAVEPTAESYAYRIREDDDASLDAAVATAAHDTLVALYPRQKVMFDLALDAYLKPIKSKSAANRGSAIGRAAARTILQRRQNDRSNAMMMYYPTGLPGNHDQDPVNPMQGFLTPMWGDVKPFVLDGGFHYVSPPPPALGSLEYAEAFDEVKRLGGDGVTTSTERTPEETEIGLFWAYDGSRYIGVPPRFFNQIVRTIAIQQQNTELENARLFALTNLAMADAGIFCWGVKYEFSFWRPVLGIRRADEDGNPLTDFDRTWTPLGAPASNQSGYNFTPPFPSYTSGHATFGGAVFRVLQRFYGRDELQFTIVSDEMNGVTTDWSGQAIRPLRPRTFSRFSDAAIENARSRIYLGIHWQFDADEGVNSGVAIGDYVYDSVLEPRRNGHEHGNRHGHGNGHGHGRDR